MLIYFVYAFHMEWIFLKGTMCKTILSINGQRRGKYRHEYEIFQETTQVAKDSITRVSNLCSFVKCFFPFHLLNSLAYKLYYPRLLLMLMQLDSSDFKIKYRAKQT